MVDIVSSETRSRMMSGIRGKDTKPELLLRKALHARGLRFRKNVRSLPGSPDLVFRKWNTVLFVNGCFWHRHKDCSKAYTPKSNIGFWERKFARTIDRDRENIDNLLAAGWRVGIVWECSLDGCDQIRLIDQLEAFLCFETKDFSEWL